MQAVLLAAGQSSRFIPYNNLAHKSLVKIMGKTIIEHTICSIKKAGIDDIIIVINKNSEIKNILDNGRHLGVNISYVLQPEALGMGDGLLKAQEFIKNDFFLIGAYHADFYEAKDLLEKKRITGKELVLLAKKDESLSIYGNLKTDGDRVLDIIEKPSKAEELSSLRIVSIYLLTKEFLETLKKTPLEHYHLEKALAAFAKENDVKFALANTDSLSLKYSWNILNIKNYLFKDLKRYISESAQIGKDVQLTGEVYISDGAKIMEKAYIKGPCFIGKNTFVGNNAIIREGVDLEENSVAGAFSEVKNTLIGQGSKVHSGFVGDSVIGENCRIGAHFCTANKRFDRKTVKAEIKEEELDTRLEFLGTVIGNNVHIGIKSSTMPGIMIGNNSLIGPSTTVLNNVPENTKYYTKFQEIIVKK